MPSRLRPAAAPATLLTALLLSACAQPADHGAHHAPAPAARFEAGGGLVRELDMTPENAPALIGDWQGPYVPVNMATGAVGSEPAGIATLYIDGVEGTILRGELKRESPEGPLPNEGWTGALTISGHFMMLNAHILLFEQEGVQFLEGDIMGPDGKFYRHRFVRMDG